ncbi:MAG: flagellar biosynthetic protein FliR [Polaromonas sp. 39-63-203]|jgi:flagellar biosynthetic protein FliR|uniref:flagellar biosynthetic protein FliR n=1 Tax=Polaromonas sp. TaxID=1869339 RepID=UPI000BD8460B|nr:flagellar biosynthetic protein FliR [Polaromonas sp.]OYY53914.1 MAG: flagellar biosynthetic protein FliR [Polaromonas sp. 35-63-240]OYZ02452.1 MAG: flagellar biosynthetic protein FliR [Polaromonas sp. 28-63-22]OYZ84905.1 MAG: flagellar biosynthetic protein FliR [Polaromonas sp. 24-62-144]OZA98991.1 MAG: flagellar biosynthetic protein FliR [Polaromonas sp. 39-63-203]HQS31580.1 flagellar biosynthetic protein FliR [Polaromonas sp.]
MPAVLSVTSEQLNVWMVAFLWPFVRMLALISTAPIFSESAVPRTAKVGLAALLAIAIAPTLGPMPAVPLVSVGGFWILIQQVLIGAAMGFSMRLVFAMVQAAGEYAGLQMGLSFASFFDPTSGGTTMVLARILNALAMLLFLAFDAHLMLIMTLADSFQALPIADAPLRAGGWFLLVSAGGQIFSGGLMLALPLIATLLTINLAMGILNRVSPQFSIFSVGFPVTLLAGMLVLQMLMQYLAPFLAPRFAAGFPFMLEFLQGLRR